MKISSLGTLLCIGSAYGLSQSSSHSTPSTPSTHTGIFPQDIHSLLQVNNVSANADLCQYSSTYQCVGSTVDYGVNSSADLTAYVFSEDSGVRIYQEDIDSLAMTFGEAAIANAGNDINSTEAMLGAYSKDRELVAYVTVSDPDMQLVQLKAARSLLQSMAVPDGKVDIIVGETVINDDDGYGQDDDYSQGDDYSNSYSLINDPLMVPLAVSAGALMVESIVVCVLAVCLYHACRRPNEAQIAEEIQRLLSASESHGQVTPVTNDPDNINNIENGPEGAQSVSSASDVSDAEDAQSVSSASESAISNVSDAKDAQSVSSASDSAILNVSDAEDDQSVSSTSSDHYNNHSANNSVSNYKNTLDCLIS